MKLLLNLKYGKVVKSFTRQPHGNWVAVEVNADDERMQHKLRTLLNGYLNAKT